MLSLAVVPSPARTALLPPFMVQQWHYAYPLLVFAPIDSGMDRDVTERFSRGGLCQPGLSDPIAALVLYLVCLVGFCDVTQCSHFPKDMYKHQLTRGSSSAGQVESLLPSSCCVTIPVIFRWKVTCSAVGFPPDRKSLHRGACGRGTACGLFKCTPRLRKKKGPFKCPLRVPACFVECRQVEDPESR